MRLINVHTRQINEFLSDAGIEAYAILSHTWGNEEVSFEDFQSLPEALLTAKKGYAKIDYCCRQAAADGYRYAWVDTCCIDKRSSAELSEAINSMFRWYKDAAVCYAYFADVQAGGSPSKMYTKLADSRWFTRGWTLQELLAPREMMLYTQDWQKIGSRVEFRDALSRITGIEVEYLCGSRPLERASVSKRMSWAATRNTSRVEDMAYCLLGVFDVNMPLLYGEGKKAFRRLQEEIMKANPTDHTLFAWGKIVNCLKRQISDPLQLQGHKPIPWDKRAASDSLLGLFAESPRDFLHSAGFSSWRGAEGFYGLSETSTSTQNPYYPIAAGASVIIQVPVFHSLQKLAFHWSQPRVTQLRPLQFAILLCTHEMSQAPGILLPLHTWGDSGWGRTDELMYASDIYSLRDLIPMKRRLQVTPQRHRDPEPGDFLLCRWGDARLFTMSRQIYHRDAIFVSFEGIIAVPSGSIGRIWAAYYRLSKDKTDKRGVGIVFDRLQSEHTRLSVGNVSVSFVPLVLSGPVTDDVVEAGADFVWTHHSKLANGRFKSLSARRMAVPVDTWRLDVAPFPIVEVRVTRMSIGAGAADIVDVVDLTINDRG